MFRKISYKSYKTAEWSGGTTTELYIYPEESQYSQRNFLFRISSAKIEAETSKFTELPDISRKLMILEGKLILNHKNHYKKEIKEFEQDSFLGSWETESFGKAQDFNLMMKPNLKGDIIHLSFLENEPQKYEITDTGFYHFYLFKGRLKISQKNIFLEEKDSLLVNNEENLSLSLFPKENCHLIISKVKI